MDRLHATLDNENKDELYNSFMQCYTRFISTPSPGDEIQASNNMQLSLTLFLLYFAQIVPAVYALSLVLQAVQYEELIDFCAAVGPTLYQVNDMCSVT